jgi:hypothetical protein
MSTFADIVRIAELTPKRRTEMLGLMEACFEGLNPDTFNREMAEKDWAILLLERETGALCGFSTLALMRTEVDGIPVRAFFSGDTIILPSHWGSLELEKAWLRFVFSHAKAEPGAKWYWFLICKGYRTYRYLPIYFQRYYPAPGTPIPPFEQAVLRTLAGIRFGRHFDPETGVIHCPGDYRLRPAIDDAERKAERDPRIAFFCERNPDWSTGSELACLTELSLDNIRRPALRALGKEGGS